MRTGVRIWRARQFMLCLSLRKWILEFERKDILAHLQEVLSSATFEVKLHGNDRLQKMLRFLVEETLDKSGRLLTGGNIKRRLFANRKLDIKADIRRLRSKLLEYYDSKEGRSAPMRIHVPKGSYVPKFVPNPNVQSRHTR